MVGEARQENVPLVVGGLVDVGVERHRRDKIRDEDCNDHSNNAGQEGEGQAFEQKLLQDVSAARAQGFEQADLSRALCNGDEHDVHYANASDT